MMDWFLAKAGSKVAIPVCSLYRKTILFFAGDDPQAISDKMTVRPAVYLIKKIDEYLANFIFLLANLNLTDETHIDFNN